MENFWAIGLKFKEVSYNYFKVLGLYGGIGTHGPLGFSLKGRRV